jgi:ABC-2 type transport system permease protein
MLRFFRDLLLFFQRDLRIAASYRAPFVLEILESLLGAAMFYYAARFVDSPELRQALPPGTSYFAYTLVGFAFFDYLNAAVDSFDRSLEEARDSGTLEPVLVTQTSLPVFLIGSSLYPFALTTFRIGIYLAWGSLLFGFPLRAANWLSVIAVLLATVLSFSGLGIFSSAYLLLFKRGNPSKWLFLSISSLVGGMLFPVSILPPWLQVVSRLNPITYALDAMRSALLEGTGFAGILSPLLILLLFAIILLPLSILAFSWALKRTKITGTLSHR